MSSEVPIAVSAAYRCSLLAIAIRETVRPSSGAAAGRMLIETTSSDPSPRRRRWIRATCASPVSTT
ncbi:hypothetical protein SCANM63S_08163 [Streptomyces canarius]